MLDRIACLVTKDTLNVYYFDKGERAVKQIPFTARYPLPKLLLFEVFLKFLKKNKVKEAFIYYSDVRPPKKPKIFFQKEKTLQVISTCKGYGSISIRLVNDETIRSYFGKINPEVAYRSGVFGKLLSRSAITSFGVRNSIKLLEEYGYITALWLILDWEEKHADK